MVTSSATQPSVDGNPLAADWDKRLLEHGGHLLQSWGWGEFKAYFGWSPDRVIVSTPDGDGLAQILYRAKGPISVGYVPRGPMMTGDPDRVWPVLRDAIDRSARRHRAIAVYLEPDRPLGLGGTFREAGVVPGPEHFQPARTVKIPLLADDAILKQMHQKTRYNVRLAMRRGVAVEVKRWDDMAALREFYELLKDTSERNEFSIHSYEYYERFMQTFQDRAFFAFAKWDGYLSSVVISAAFGDEATYMYGASSTEHRAHGASFLLQFEAMKWAREQGCERYDLWGIPKVDPESLRADDNSSIAGSKGEDWRGIFRFKTGFGGEIVSYPPTMERRYMPILPALARRMGLVQG